MNSCAKYFKYLLVILSYAASISTLSLGLIYSKKIPAANQYCLLCSFYIGIFGNMLILNPLRVLINSLLLPCGYSSRLLSLILSKDAIQLYKEVLLVRLIASQKSSLLQNFSQNESDVNKEIKLNSIKKELSNVFKKTPQKDLQASERRRISNHSQKD